MLEQHWHGVALKKFHMNSNPNYFNWMVFVISMFLSLAESRRNKQCQAWMWFAKLFIDFDGELNLTRLFAELFYYELHVPSKAINTRDLTLLLALMKFWAWLAKFCRLNPWFLACNINLAHACGFISNLIWILDKCDIACDIKDIAS